MQFTPRDYNALPGTAAPAIFFILVYCAVVTLFYPGIMTPDSDYQLHMAHSHLFGDWHPPILSLLWEPLDLMVPGPLGMLVLFAAGYSFAFYLFARCIMRSSPTMVWPICLFAVSPLGVLYVGVIWKDVQMATCFLLAIGAGLFRHKGTWVVVAGLVAAVLGLLARHNAVLVLPPILYLLFWGTDINGLWRVLKRLAISFVIACAIDIAASKGLDIWLAVNKTQPLSQLLLFDLIAISTKVGRNLLPGQWSEAESARIVSGCYEPQWWDRIWQSCAFVSDNLQASGELPVLIRAWLPTVLHHPIYYLEHRLDFVASNMKTSPFGVFPHTTELGKSFGSIENQHLIESYVQYFATSDMTKLLFTMGFWIVAPAVFFAVQLVFVWRFRPAQSVSFFLLLASFLYCTPQAFVGVSIDLRYTYFGILAAGLGLIFLCDEWLRSPSSRTLSAIAKPPSAA